ncbi:excinuclease ABC subunit UvrA [Metamycoplasma hyosynoviae]|uniref:excinuclease ABC subunit UvrA n=1 Tax=Metamycoplasma hyosynoviae TaxID=29559 RepID=UPI002358998F|nr:excinuclease ABC subunit UvrA [Metamycoplasma hyosynoviae]MDC8920447.1 excinuclease ABC subunit UvrA [Metamycoplasma hyosynoviae]MDC8962275.1 excinuclease ABC subunit UvrA [Metamycoplasma hyosynoviae]MDD1378982.1 excinuclease ABC subunit UvrA [Metamycoplasma hyosynoviae]MDD7848335.1 excinuclease ABC subunit UvrA [Metamycoplasma hyosynoviae]MDD7895541.1 excinuclease ABC subunit UvrA [Metamycoplasma hyosynoviae]
MQEKIIIKGARENNLKNVSLEIPRNKFVVFTGVSGSGKSSLAFNTIYEEGKRRYVDSLSSYARQFLGGTRKPDVDSIEGLSPTISIEQKTIHNNPRSIVGTVTEIYDYFRLLYARIGKPYCPNHKKEISAKKLKDIISTIFEFSPGEKIFILSPVVIGEKGTHQNILRKLKNEGFLRVKINDNIYSLDDEINLDKNKKWNIDIVIDRIVLSEEKRSRIVEAVEIALNYSHGIVTIENPEGTSKTFSIQHSCEFGDFDMPKIDPKLFSFNSPAGMCENCKGLGFLQKASFDLLAPNKKLSIREGGILYYKNLVDSVNLEWQEFENLLNYYSIDLDKPLDELTEYELEIIKYGSNEPVPMVRVSANGNRYDTARTVEGILNKIERRYIETVSNDARKYFSKYLTETECSVCHGKRLNKYALAVKLNDKNIYDVCTLPIDEIYEFVQNLNLTDIEKEIANLILNELNHRLSFLINVGLEYLTLNRKAETLSGGEAQRIRLATQIGSNLTSILYIMDEPSIGLHQKDNQKLINSLRKMVDIGNSLIVVEHDEDTIRQSDYIVDIGLLAGKNGGEIIASGSLENIKQSPNSITGKFLSGQEEIAVPSSRRSGNGKNLILEHANLNNLKNLTVNFPLGKFIVVSGVSGSGKSSLINGELVKNLKSILSNKYSFLLEHNDIKKMDTKVKGWNFVDDVILVDQSPIGRTPRSNPATYTSVFDDIRDIFGNIEASRERGFNKSRFSFNVPGGRCDKCYGDGSLRIEMHFLPDVYVTCDHCDGKRYNSETLEIKYHGKNINDVLEMTVQEAYAFFITNPKLRDKLQLLMEVGLDYIKLGQSSTTLSGGEAQRIKLATYLQKKPTGKSLYVLDEPTTGLHAYDIKKLLAVLNKIVDGGDTVIVIEHNLDVIKSADHIIDLGPGGGKSGGRVIATGTPEQVSESEISYTAEYLRKILK